MAEQFRLEQVGREGRGVQRDEGLGRARTVPVKRPGDEFLAGAGLPGDQHRHAGAGQPSHGTEYLLHGRGLPEQLRDAASRRLDVGGNRRLLCGAPDQVNRLVDVEGLRQVLEGAALISGDGRVEIRMRRHHDDGQAGARSLDFLEQIEAAAPGHANVRHQYVRRVAAQRGEHVVRLVEGFGHHAAPLQRFFEDPANRGVVVDQPDLQRFCGHVESMGSKMMNTVLPGVLSNSMRPPCRLTKS